MDNLTHSLVGLALAEGGFRRRTALATATLVIGANLPDVDALVYLVGDGTDALAFRRGWTHGLLAMALWPFALAAVMLAWDRWRQRHTSLPRPLVDVRWLLAAAAVGVWSHPLLDWFNSYGVRLLMPFSGRWFYGDALFIIDPWVWGAFALGVVWSRRRGTPGAARTVLVLGGAYVVGMIAVSRWGVVAVHAAADPPPSARVMVGPVPIWPHQREVIRDLGDSLETGRLQFTPAPAYTPTGRQAVGLDSALVHALTATRQGANFLAWSRFPVATTATVGDSLRVRLSDVRYGTGRSASWATVEVVVPAPER